MEKVKLYLEEQRTMRSNRTYELRKQILNEYMNFSHGDFSREKCIEYIASLKERENRDTTIAYKIKTINYFVEWCVRRGDLEKNEIKLINVPKGNKIQLELPDSDQVGALFEYKPGNKRNLKRNVAMVEFILTTGVRASELCSLVVSDVDFETDVVYIKNGKGKKPRIAALHPHTKLKLLEYLSEREISLENSKSNGEPLFLGQRQTNGELKRMSRTSVTAIFKRYCNEAIGKDLSAHDGRHIFASIMCRAGVPLTTIQNSLGHSSARTTSIYLHSLNVSDEIKEGSAAAFSFLS